VFPGPSETREPAAPHLITHIHTTPAPVHGDAVLDGIHTTLAERALPPDEHLVGAAFAVLRPPAPDPTGRNQPAFRPAGARAIRPDPPP
jgi:hypothetical protein